MEADRASAPVQVGPASSSGGPASTGMEVLLQEAQARVLAANIESIDLSAGPATEHLNGKAHASSSAGGPQQLEPQPAAALEGSKALNGAAGRALTFRGIVFDLETTGEQPPDTMLRDALFGMLARKAVFTRPPCRGERAERADRGDCGHGAGIGGEHADAGQHLPRSGVQQSPLCAGGCASQQATPQSAMHA